MKTTKYDFEIVSFFGGMIALIVIQSCRTLENVQMFGRYNYDKYFLDDVIITDESNLTAK